MNLQRKKMIITQKRIADLNNEILIIQLLYKKGSISLGIRDYEIEKRETEILSLL